MHLRLGDGLSRSVLDPDVQLVWVVVTVVLSVAVDVTYLVAPQPPKVWCPRAKGRWPTHTRHPCPSQCSARARSGAGTARTPASRPSYG
jgi:hypothetical protein